jgi:hypothetical protein
MILHDETFRSSSKARCSKGHSYVRPNKDKVDGVDGKLEQTLYSQKRPISIQISDTLLVRARRGENPVCAEDRTDHAITMQADGDHHHGEASFLRSHFREQ